MEYGVLFCGFSKGFSPMNTMRLVGPCDFIDDACMYMLNEAYIYEGNVIWFLHVYDIVSFMSSLVGSMKNLPIYLLPNCICLPYDAPKSHQSNFHTMCETQVHIVASSILLNLSPMVTSLYLQVMDI